MTSVDGLIYLGIEKGLRKYRARLVVTDSRGATTKKYNTKIVIWAQSKADAQAQRAEALKKFEAMKLGHVARPTRRSFKDVAEAWFATLDSFGTSLSWGSHMRALVRQFGDQWLDTITTDELQRYLATIKGTRKLPDGSPRPLDTGTVNSRRDVLKKIFGYAVEQGLRPDNPAETTKRKRKQKSVAQHMEELELPKSRSLTAEQLPLFFAELKRLHHDTYPIVLTQYALGCRFAEVSALRWRDVDLSKGSVVLRRGQVLGHVGPTKNRKARLAGVGPTALAVLKRHRLEMMTAKWKGYEELVFPRPPLGGNPNKHGNNWAYGTVANHIKDVFKRLGIDVKSVTHAARHTFHNNARQQNNEILMRSIVGHATVEQSLIYSEAQIAEVIDFATAVDKAMKLGAK